MNINTGNARLFRTLFSLFFLIIFLGQVTTASAAVIYKVEGENGSAYLVGAMHIGTENLYPLDPKLEEKLKTSRFLATEGAIGQDPEWGHSLAKLLKLSANEHIEDFVSPVYFEKAKSILKNKGTYPAQVIDQFSRYYPFPTYQLVGDIVPADNHLYLPGTEMYLGAIADRNNIPKVILEDPADFVNAVKSFTLSEMDILMQSVISLFENKTLRDKNFSHSQKLAALTKQGDFANVKKIDEEFMIQNLSWTPGIFNKLTNQRNLGMSKRIIELMKQGAPVFVVVGGSHIPGPEGIVNLLRLAGYTVTEE
ncbi:TraB/GumN family protein [Undibacterium sp. Ji49W]|uniref:TraB/GumN family protein n=1 Tax=Undibacterium sp. Ji49W TaxID=3413040 RepID=UPI003BF2AD26